MTEITAPTPDSIEFTDAQLGAAVRQVEQLFAAAVVIASQLEVRAWRERYGLLDEDDG